MNELKLLRDRTEGGNLLETLRMRLLLLLRMLMMMTLRDCVFEYLLFTARCYASAELAMGLSVRLSVTGRCSVETAERIELLDLHCSLSHRSSSSVSTARFCRTDQLATADTWFRTCRTSSFCTVAWQLARFQLTRRIARSLSDS